MKNKIINITIFFVVFLAMLSICEVIFRYVIPTPYRIRNLEFYSAMYQPDNELGHILKPNMRNEHLNTNSYGFRGSELKLGRVNIICIGDSHTFGWGVDDKFTYPQQLQDLLGDKFNVINMGVGGYQISRQLAILNRFIEELKPKAVVFGVTVDDIFKDLPAQPITLNSEEQSSKPHKNLKLRSALVTYIRDALPGIQIKLGLRKPAHEEYYRFWNDKEYFDFYKKEVEKELIKLSKLHIKVTFVIFPFPSQVYLMDNKISPATALFSSLESKDIKHIDLLPVFQTNYKRVSTLYLEDGHPNEYAYKLVAQEIFIKLKEQNLIDVKDN